MPLLKLVYPAAHFTDHSILRYFSREIDQFQSTWVLFGMDKTIIRHVSMSTSCRLVNVTPCLWSQLVSKFPVRIWIRDKFKIKIDRSVKTPWAPDDGFLVYALITERPSRGLDPGEPRSFAPRHLQISPTQGQYSSTKKLPLSLPRGA